MGTIRMRNWRKKSGIRSGAAGGTREWLQSIPIIVPAIA